jgi:cob(I)alamin adenosyltransferase
VADPIAFIDLQAQRRRLGAPLEAAIKAAVEGGQWILGPAVQQLETRLAGYLRLPHAVGVASGTDALLLALRAVGCGMRVLMLEFIKGSWHYGELDAVKAFGDKFVIKQMGRGFVKVHGADIEPEDYRLVEVAWAEAREAIYSGEWDLVILDEINCAISCEMLDAAVVAEALRGKPERVHVILTGRNAPPLLVELADTVTEMRAVKHAYEKGIMAQRGIEY